MGVQMNVDKRTKITCFCILTGIYCKKNVNILTSGGLDGDGGGLDLWCQI